MVSIRQAMAMVGVFMLAGSVLSAEGTAPVAGGGSLRLAGIFCDHMVLQNHAPLPVWGWAKSGAEVTVELAGQKKTAVAGADGCWRITLDPIEPSDKPLELIVSAAGEAAPVTVKDVLIGEVWLCSGQSNMDFSLGSAENGAQEIAAANFPQIRFFTVPHVLADAPAAEVKGNWAVCSPQTAGGAYAAAFFFAKDLQAKLQTPIGLIQAAWSGMPAEAAIPREALADDPELSPILNRFYADKGAYEAAKRAYDVKLPVWQAERRPVDRGNSGEKAGWAKAGADLAKWGTVSLPMMFMHADPGLYGQGAVWFRRDVELPEGWTGHALKLELGPISDFDTTYFNGRKIGSTDADSPETAKLTRSYAVPADLVRASRNVVAVRIFTRYGESGFGGKPEELRLVCTDADDAKPIPLAGPWCYCVEQLYAFKPMPRAPIPPDSNWSPTRVYNGMIAPLVPFAIRGVLWYQGEHNGDAAAQYRKLFPALIASWRKHWGQGDFPFIYAQLPNWLHRQEIPADCSWAELRDVQRQCLSVSKTGMAVTIDVGDPQDIHPKKKQPVGHRLALAAEKVAYGLDVPYSGPLYKSMKVEGDSVRLSFDCVFGGLKTSDGAELKGFTIAGADRRFVPALASIEGEQVVVKSAEIPQPTAVRYAWQYNPACNLMNGEGLPASPFRTDDWPFLLPLGETEPDLK